MDPLPRCDYTVAISIKRFKLFVPSVNSKILPQSVPLLTPNFLGEITELVIQLSFPSFTTNTNVVNVTNDIHNDDDDNDCAADAAWNDPIRPKTALQRTMFELREAGIDTRR